MIKNFKILLIDIYFITLSVSVYAGGLHSGSIHFAVNHNAFSRHNSKHTSKSFAKQKLKFHRKWHHKTRGTNKIIFSYYVYYPYYASYGKEEDSYVEINIIDDKKDEQIESTVDKDKSFSPPRVVNWEDVEPNNTENVILIYGTKVIETTISSD